MNNTAPKLARGSLDVSTRCLACRAWNRGAFYDLKISQTVHSGVRVDLKALSPRDLRIN